MKKIQRIVTYCVMGALTFSGNTVVSKAAELPIAGINLVLNDFYQNDENEDISIKEYLSNVFSEYDSISFAQVSNYVNIRSKANEEAKILGKLYDNSYAKILEKKEDWYKVKSGSVTGYIKADFLITGLEAEKFSKTVGTRIATVTTTTLKVRDDANMDAPVLTLVPIEEELIVKKEVDDWVKVVVTGNDIGFVSADYVDIRTEYEEAVSIEEEQERLAAEEEARVASEQAQAINTYNYVKPTSNANKSGKTLKSKTSTPVKATTSSLRSKIVEYALQFEGNPYVWGGTSLTKGADCSGFTQSVFRDNGISIPRTSRTQATGGQKISVDNLKPGDLIFYDRNGTINHVALYIGDGKVIGASSPKTGIRITKYNYRQPYKVVNYID